MRTYPDPMQRIYEEATSRRDAPDTEALRAEVTRLRTGIEAMRDFAKERAVLMCAEDMYRMCEDLLRKETT